MTTLIAFTGGPCAGKDSVLPLAKQFLEDRGVYTVTLQESATELILSGFHPVEGWPTDIRFQEHHYAFQTAKEFRFRRMLEEVQTPKPKVLLCNRGVPDGRAYADPVEFRRMIGGYGESLQSLFGRYKGVIHLVTTAIGAPEAYTRTNNAARREGLHEAIEADERTQAAWLGHPHFVMIDNSTDWMGKVKRVFAALARFLDIPAPMERERKFFVRRLGPIPTPSTVVDIEQSYLATSAEGEERRIRKRTLDGVASYYYTTKTKVAPGERLERERQISTGEYAALLHERHFAFDTIVKQRTCFTFGGQHFELDRYLSPYPGLLILEAEVNNLKDPLILPPGFEADDVTGDDQWSNFNISRGVLRDDRIQP